jgi:hypothetical protein
MNVMKVTSAMPTAPKASDYGPQLTSRGLTWEQGIWMDMKARRVMMRMRRRRWWKKHCNLMIDQCRMWRTEVIVGYVDGYECDDVDANEEEYAPQADDGSTQNLED